MPVVLLVIAVLKSTSVVASRLEISLESAVSFGGPDFVLPVVMVARIIFPTVIVVLIPTAEK